MGQQGSVGALLPHQVNRKRADEPPTRMCFEHLCALARLQEQNGLRLSGADGKSSCGGDAPRGRAGPVELLDGPGRTGTQKGGQVAGALAGGRRHQLVLYEGPVVRSLDGPEDTDGRR